MNLYATTRVAHVALRDARHIAQKSPRLHERRPLSLRASSCRALRPLPQALRPHPGSAENDRSRRSRWCPAAENDSSNSLANVIMAAVGIALGNDRKRQDRAVAEILRGRDLDAELAALLDGEPC